MSRVGSTSTRRGEHAARPMRHSLTCREQDGLAAVRADRHVEHVERYVIVSVCIGVELSDLSERTRRGDGDVVQVVVLAHAHVQVRLVDPLETLDVARVVDRAEQGPRGRGGRGEAGGRREVWSNVG